VIVGWDEGAGVVGAKVVVGAKAVVGWTVTVGAEVVGSSVWFSVGLDLNPTDGIAVGLAVGMSVGGSVGVVGPRINCVCARRSGHH
jgi:hypothetical protein